MNSSPALLDHDIIIVVVRLSLRHQQGMVLTENAFNNRPLELQINAGQKRECYTGLGTPLPIG